jgi:hypothetical protein
MSGIINILHYFLPISSSSELGITAMHFIEPTKSNQDEFIGLIQGKLLRVDEEPTSDFSYIYSLCDDISIKKKPELLPLSGYCKGVGIPMNAFRIEGDPLEYCSELKNLSFINSCHLIILPFNETNRFSRQLLWTSLLTTTLPILLLMDLPFPTSSGPGHVTNGTNGNPEEQHQHQHQQHHHRSSFVQPFTNLLPSSATRYQRATSISVTRDEELGTTTDGQQQQQQQQDDNNTDNHYSTSSTSPQPQLFSNLPIETLPIHRRRSITNKVHKLSTVTSSIKQVIIILSGKLSMDLLMLCGLLHRFHENHKNEITILLPSDYLSFYEKEIIEIILKLKEDNNNSSSSLKFVEVTAVSSDYDTLVKEISQLPYDLIVCGFIEPPPSTASTIAVRRPSASAVSGGGVSSVGDRVSAFIEMLSNLTSSSAPSASNTPAHDSVEPISIEERITIGIPSQYLHCPLPFPELGVLGSKLYEHATSKGISKSLMMIIHESMRRVVGRHSIMSQDTAVLSHHNDVELHVMEMNEDTAISNV